MAGRLRSWSATRCPVGLRFRRAQVAGRIGSGRLRYASYRRTAQSTRSVALMGTTLVIRSREDREIPLT